MAYLFFGYFAGTIAITSILVVVLRNPVYSALSLLVMFFHVAGLYIILHAEFLAAVQVIVYAGAILVLYLFVVMLLNVKRDDRYHSQWRVAAIVCVPLSIEFLVLLSGGMGASHRDPASVAVDPQTSDNTLAIGQTLFSTYLFPFSSETSGCRSSRDGDAGAAGGPDFLDRPVPESRADARAHERRERDRSCPSGLS